LEDHLASLHQFARFSLFSLLLGVAIVACWLIMWVGTPGSFTRALPYGAGLVAAAGALAILSARHGRWFADRGTPPAAIAVVIAVGCILRLAVALAWPTEQFSDSADYWQSAARFVRGEGVYFHLEGFELKAFRPPGVTLLLAAPIWVFGASALIPPFVNVACYVAASLALYGLGKRCLSDAGVLFAVALLACHPSQIYHAALVNAEAPSMAALMLGLWLLTSTGRVLGVLASGAIFGVVALIKPVYVGLALAVLLAGLVDVGHRFRRWRTVLLVVAGMAMTIAPWTIRTHAALDGFALISTNGGSVFYRSNNPLASGTYSERGERDLHALAHDELLLNKTGFAWGVEWIRRHPVDFVMLAVKKVGILLGDSFVGPDTGYYRFERAWQAPEQAKRLAETIGRCFWLAVWTIFLAALMANVVAFANAAHWSLLAIVLFLPLSAHAIFESQMRHLLTVGPIIFLFAGSILGGPKTPKAAGQKDRGRHGQDRDPERQVGG
jgi:hypothetical protein